MSWTTAILHLFIQETDLLMKIIMKCVNRKLWDILGCFHYILNAPRINPRMTVFWSAQFSGDKFIRQLVECGFEQIPFTVGIHVF